MRSAGLLLFACLIGGAAHAQQAGSISSTALSRCAGKVGADTRAADPAFVTIALDGVPWLTIERTEEEIGTQQVATTVTGTGWRRRRDGTSVPFRFTCLLDTQGQAVMFHASNLLRGLGDDLPPSIAIEGAASFLEKVALPRGVELQVQLLDIAKSPPEILAEQVVRSGWQVPIPFTLHLPKDTVLDGRKLEITARFVRARQALFQLRDKRTLTPADLHKFIILSLDKAEDSNR